MASTRRGDGQFAFSGAYRTTESIWLLSRPVATPLRASCLVFPFLLLTRHKPCAPPSVCIGADARNPRTRLDTQIYTTRVILSGGNGRKRRAKRRAVAACTNASHSLWRPRSEALLALRRKLGRRNWRAAHLAGGQCIFGSDRRATSVRPFDSEEKEREQLLKKAE